MTASLSRQALLRYGPAAAMTALVAALSLLPVCVFHGVESTLPHFGGLDKVVHALMYAALTATYLNASPLSKRLRLGRVLRTALAVALYGLSMEFCQGWLTRTRTQDMHDALANAGGAFTCALLAHFGAKRAHKTLAGPDCPRPEQSPTPRGG